MATLILTTVGSALGGPIGGAVGALIGSQIDGSILGARRQGPRIRELAATAASYGTPIARHFGTMRAPGTIVWATDLIETSERSGGKGRPATTTYSYSASFAVALASRPIRRLGRVWADGTLLRGAAGDLKIDGELRVYLGHGDQEPDPLIASAQDAGCPAFRGLAYCVFEALQLADFGNRIPALTFEIVADDGDVSLASLVSGTADVDAQRPLPGLVGFSDEGGPLAAALANVAEVYPIACDASGERLTLRAGDLRPPAPAVLPEATVDPGDDGFGGQAGWSGRRQPDAQELPDGLHYYDPARDHQAGLQRADGRARPGRSRTIEFPGALAAGTARGLVNAAAERADRGRETLLWRMAELDPEIVPGAVVRVPGRGGHWRIDSWEWRERGIELALCRLPHGPGRQSQTDAGEALTAPDLVATPTRLLAYELPWDGTGRAETRQVFAAASSASAGWTGASLHADEAGGLVPLGSSGGRRSRIGQLDAPLPVSPAVLFEREAVLDVELVSPDFLLADASLETLAAGANRALVGGEVLQFAEAAPLGGKQWRLRGLLRGRGGTEAAAQAGHLAGTPFVLLDDGPVALDPARLSLAVHAIAAIGLADAEPVRTPIANPGLALRPLAPVHPHVRETDGGGLTMRWTRRARGAWLWLDGVETPLNEQTEAYVVGLGSSENPAVRWEVTSPTLVIPAGARAELAAAHAGEPLWVRQIGSFAQSDALLLTTIS